MPTDTEVFEKEMVITRNDLEWQLSLLQESSLDPSGGLFGPGSVVWKVNRESAMLLGAGRALLLQLSHPLVAAAVAKHSSVLNNPLRRLHHTFSIMFSMVFGTIDQCFEAARTLHGRHALVRGCLSDTVGPYPAGTPYCANDATLLQWVHSTLVESAHLVYASAFSPLSNEEQEQFYQESRRMAGLFGLPKNSLPPTWAAFRQYVDTMCRSGALSISPFARDLIDRMFGKGWNRLPNWYQAVTAQLLQPSLREALGLHYGRTEQNNAEHAWKLVRSICPLLPYHLRYVGPYQEAQARIEGKAPSLVTKSINHLWIGRSTLRSFL